MKVKTLWQKWVSNSEEHPDQDAVIHWVAGEEPFRWTSKTLIETAEKIASHLLQAGIKRNHVCAIIMRHNIYFYPLYMAVSSIGALPAVLAYPNPRLHPDKFREGLAGMCERSGLDWILSEEELKDIIKPFVDANKDKINDLLYPLNWDLNAVDSNEIKLKIAEIQADISESDPVLLQHSSGTTGLQKPVVLSHRAIADHVEYYGESIGFNKHDKIVSWLPLYHDMGLIAAFHMPLFMGIPTLQLDPFEWVVAPVIQIEAIDKEKATLAWLPNFAYNFMADRIADDETEGLSMDSLRMVINCSEPVRQESHDKFYNKFVKLGFKKESLSACYAMAETTFAVSQTLPDQQAGFIKVDRDALSQGKVKPSENSSTSRICVSSGRLIKGCSVKIVDENRAEVEPGFVGEISIHSVSLFDGYRNYPEKTADALDDKGWYYTGDYGFMFEDELYVIGRKKDIIIEAGNNIYPEDVEDALNKVNGVIAGRVIAFGEEDETLGTEHVSVIVETKEEKEKFGKLKLDIIKAGMEINVNIKNVYLVPPRWLIKSSSGKPSRKANSRRIINKDLEQVWS